MALIAVLYWAIIAQVKQ